jgi:two-component system CheB/CheR fusion protein
MMVDDDKGFENVLQFLLRERGFDFSGYKRPSLVRRLQKRMQMAGIASFDDYVEHLELHPDEFPLLFNTLLINVTSFFRDAAAWEALSAEVIPAILERKPGSEPIRVWSAGCASGEEAYSIAIALTEAMGAESFRERVKIYATDMDEEALSQARAASYTEKDLQPIDATVRERYFESVGGRSVFRADLRRAVIFGRHDLVQDAPISRLDLLVCRNTLMYFNAETQKRILERFHFALENAGGFLFLGRAELLLTHGALFQPLNLKCRIFAKVPSPDARNRAGGAAHSANDTSDVPMATRNDPLKNAALDELPVARIVVDLNGNLVLSSQRARTLFSLNPKDIGRPLQDLEISYRPAELRSLIEQAYAERRTVTKTSVERRFADGDTQYLDIVVTPLVDEGGSFLGVSATFVDVTRMSQLQEDLRRTKEEIQTAHEELQSSNEELETTNEELQSSNEELETTNEELQSTNEELETMNEELQSTNEELQTVNEELRQRSEELNHSNAFLESVLSSLRSGAVVVNQNLNVLVWNHRAEDLWGLRADEVQGKSLLNLDIGLPVGDLRDVIRPCLSGESDHREVVVDATTRRGKGIKCRITCTPLISQRKEPHGAILLMEDVGPGA